MKFANETAQIRKENRISTTTTDQRTHTSSSSAQRLINYNLLICINHAQYFTKRMIFHVVIKLVESNAPNFFFMSFMVGVLLAFILLYQCEL